jgi:hypothetical protein
MPFCVTGLIGWGVQGRTSPKASNPVTTVCLQCFAGTSWLACMHAFSEHMVAGGARASRALVLRAPRLPRLALSALQGHKTSRLCRCRTRTTDRACARSWGTAGWASCPIPCAHPPRRGWSMQQPVPVLLRPWGHPAPTGQHHRPQQRRAGGALPAPSPLPFLFLARRHAAWRAWCRTCIVAR